MKIFRSIKPSYVFQKFGKENTYPSVLALYNSLGLLGHNGWDFSAKDGDKIYWDCSLEGEVIGLSTDLNAGYGIEILTEENGKLHKHRFWHLRTDGILVKAGQKVGSGDLIALADNTGKYTTGTHLHRDLKECKRLPNGVLETLNTNNGYLGAIDLKPFYVDMFIGDYIANQQGQISILQKMIKLISDFLKVGLN
jgi:murein DD-endopeptidase MepM/ murein hydrolase activator NlpD